MDFALLHFRFGRKGRIGVNLRLSIPGSDCVAIARAESAAGRREVAHVL